MASYRRFLEIIILTYKLESNRLAAYRANFREFSRFLNRQRSVKYFRDKF